MSFNFLWQQTDHCSGSLIEKTKIARFW